MKRKFINPEIRVFLTPDTEPDIGGKYCAVIFDWDNNYKEWYNTGIVARSDDPTDVFNKIFAIYNERKKE